MFCKECGNSLNENAVFCSKCGASVADANANENIVESAIGTNNHCTVNRSSQASLTGIIGSPRLTKAMFWCGTIFSALYFVATIISSLCGKVIATQFYPMDFSETDFSPFIPYGTIVVGFVEMIAFVLVLMSITKQLHTKKCGIAVEVIIITYGTVIRFVVNILVSVLRSRNCTGYLNGIAQNADAYKMQLLSAANSAISSWYSILAILSTASIAFVLVGCGASIATKQSTKQSKGHIL